MTEQSYNKEVEKLYDIGVTKDIAVQLLEHLTDVFHERAGHFELEEFRSRLLDMRKNDRSYFRSIIDDTCGEYPLPKALTWRHVKYEPKRVTRCVICSRFFYDSSRNGRRVTCNNLICPREFEARRGRGGDILAPEYIRKVHELLTDYSPAASDRRAIISVRKIEMAAFLERIRE